HQKWIPIRRFLLRPKWIRYRIKLWPKTAVGLSNTPIYVSSSRPTISSSPLNAGSLLSYRGVKIRSRLGIGLFLEQFSAECAPVASVGALPQHGFKPMESPELEYFGGSLDV